MSFSRIAILFLSLNLVGCSCVMATEAPSASQKPFHTLLPRGAKTLNVFAEPLERRYWGNTQQWCTAALLAHFNPSMLSQPTTNLTMKVNVSPSGRLACKVLSANNCTIADRFYCEQSMWESAPIRSPADTEFEGWTGTISFKGTDASKHRTDGSVEMHLVPWSVFHFYPYAFSEKQLVDDSNMRRIDVGRALSGRLQAFRKEWVEFVLSNPDVTTDELSKRVLSMERKYHGLFEKR